MQHLQPNTTLQGGKYRIERVLGQGGFGNTYVGYNTEFEETVAIKEFFMRGVTQRDDNQTTVSVSNSENRDSFKEQKEKFKKEARRLRKLNNEHIVKVHDLFEENGTAYYVMDYVDGENLAERLERTGKPLTEQEVRLLVPQILNALSTVHNARIWHLDLKPSNIMVDKNDNVKLIDFGASKQMRVGGGPTTNAPTAIPYTQGYAPREQMEHNIEKIGPWTDIYALGATLYALLTKRKPPLPSDIDDDMSADKHLALPFPNGVSNNLHTFILKMMQTDRKQRPQSIEELCLLWGTSFSEKKPSTVRDNIASSIDDETFVDVSNTELVDDDTKKLADYNVYGLVITDPTPKSDGNQIITVNGVSFKMIRVEGGTFTMGATSEQGSDAHKDEKPAHRVTLSSYYIGETEVTQELWKAVMGSNPSYFKGYNRPVEKVSWDDCQTFIRKLNDITGKSFRLPTEAEWEFAARGGNKSNGYKYSGSNSVERVAWYDGNSGFFGKTHDVKTKAANELGIYDMSGNVWEWCQDWYGNYNSSVEINPTWPSSGYYRVLRGGGWSYDAWYCRVSFRCFNTPEHRGSYLGLRLAL